MAEASTSTSTAGTNTKKSSKKRKLSEPSEPAASDPRFNFSAFDLTEDDDNDDLSSLPREEEETSTTTKSKPLPSHLLPTSSSKSRKTPGLIYLSRIPPGMGPSKVKSLLSAYGDVGRVFLARSDSDPPASNNPNKKRKKEKHREHRFAEGWIEFMDKKVARSVAEMLNANPIGGKKGSRWRDDVWTMKYLPKFRWDQLSEQVALERATQTSLLRFHLQNSKTEQESYLSAVEKSRVQDAIKTKAESRRLGKVEKGEISEEKKSAGSGKERNYRQREVVDVGKKGREGTKEDLENVLGRLF